MCVQMSSEKRDSDGEEEEEASEMKAAYSIEDMLDILTDSESEEAFVDTVEEAAKLESKNDQEKDQGMEITSVVTGSSGICNDFFFN